MSASAEQRELSDATTKTLHLTVGDTHTPRTGGSVGWASGCYAEGREIDSSQTITQGLKITKEKVPPLQLHPHVVRLSSLLDKDFQP